MGASAEICLGSAFAVLIFMTTFSFLFSLPGWEPVSRRLSRALQRRRFLVKDICLLGVALWSLGEAAGAVLHTADSSIISHPARGAVVRRSS